MATLRIDWEKVKQAREAARQIVEDVHSYTQQFTTTTIERSICRLLGIDGVDAMGVPLPNVVVDHLASRQILGLGASYWLGQAAISLGKEPQTLAEAVARGELDLTRIDPVDNFEIQLWAEKEPKKRSPKSTIIALSGKKDCLNLAIMPGHSFMLLLPPGIFTKISPKPRQPPGKARTLSLSSAPPAKACSITFPMARRPRALAAQWQLRKTFA